MKKALIIFLVFFGILFFITGSILALNPFNLRTKIIGAAINNYLGIEQVEEVSSEEKKLKKSKDQHPLLTQEQEEVLEDLGVNVSSLPTEISVDTQNCFINAFGEDRALELAKGSSPTIKEILAGKNCL